MSIYFLHSVYIQCPLGTLLSPSLPFVFFVIISNANQMSFKTRQSQTEDKKARVEERKETWSAAFIKALKMFLKMETTS